jgi:hypothetical protein
MNTPITYESILRTVASWPPAQRFSLVQDLLKTLSPRDVGDALELTPTQIAEDVRAALADYSSGRLVEIQSVDDLVRLVRDSDEDATYSTSAL